MVKSGIQGFLSMENRMSLGAKPKNYSKLVKMASQSKMAAITMNIIDIVYMTYKMP